MLVEVAPLRGCVGAPRQFAPEVATAVCRVTDALVLLQITQKCCCIGAAGTCAREVTAFVVTQSLMLFQLNLGHGYVRAAEDAARKAAATILRVIFMLVLVKSSRSRGRV
eukprot:gnl/TRDRNA2_/TRDRNA2_11490_c0_seq1.p1 gnl/TRDRNA2_/TRDRNA2_11490_c0~~gnl/TRDRNA2_/TRDRNA2_11490_c0_seq1.p1  ORF type:complete len:110 (-),score=10.06 gnl/TRDRNA2_/TRDRNA2_11490_c0_seq1:84-413(-)